MFKKSVLRPKNCINKEKTYKYCMSANKTINRGIFSSKRENLKKKIIIIKKNKEHTTKSENTSKIYTKKNLMRFFSRENTSDYKKDVSNSRFDLNQINTLKVINDSIEESKKIILKSESLYKSSDSELNLKTEKTNSTTFKNEKSYIDWGRLARKRKVIKEMLNQNSISCTDKRIINKVIDRIKEIQSNNNLYQLMGTKNLENSNSNKLLRCTSLENKKNCLND